MAAILLTTLLRFFTERLPAANFILQVLVFGVLVWYAIETWQIRRLSFEQIEALQKPCLTFISTARDPQEAVLEMDGIVGGMIVAAREGNVAIQNVGSGPALNVRYKFTPVKPPAAANVARPSGYLQNIPPRETLVMPVPREVLRNLEYEFIASFESLNGRTYETRVRMNDLVLTQLEFGPRMTALGGEMTNGTESGNQVHEWWRFFGNLRFTQLAFYGVAAGLLLNAQRDGMSPGMQSKIGLAGVLVTGVVWLMEISATLHGIAWKKLAKPDPPTWLLPPFNASNAALLFYVLAYLFWSSMAVEHLRAVRIVFWVLTAWSIFAYLPLWLHSIGMLRTTLDTYGKYFRRN
jgi:hypothetical protein